MQAAWGRCRDGDHLVGRRHLEVERQGSGGLDASEIVVADMTAVFAQVRGNAVAADRSDNLGGAHWIGMIAAASVPDRRNVIDVDAQPQPAGTA